MADPGTEIPQGSRCQIRKDWCAVAVQVPDPFRTRHYTVPELAAAWNVSDDTIRKLFRREPGVVSIRNPRPGRRDYTTLRVPEDVAQRVYRRLMKA